MRFQINFKSGKPVYLQLVDQAKAALASGALEAGDPLPSIRLLAEDLRVNRNTVAKAYAELESQHVIETIAGKGCFVRDAGSPFKKDVRLKLLADDIDHAVVQAGPRCQFVTPCLQTPLPSTFRTWFDGTAGPTR